VSNGDGCLPLHLACANKAPLELIQFLVKKGGSHAIQTTTAVYGHLPLQYACARAASLEVIQYLVSRWGEAVKAADSDGDLPLHMVCEVKAPLEVVQFLVEQWSEAIKTTNNHGYLPLHHACKNKAPLDVVDFLLQWPEAVKITDFEGKTPLDYAQMPDADGGEPIPEVITWLQVVADSLITISIPLKQLPASTTTSKPEPGPESSHSQGEPKVPTDEFKVTREKIQKAINLKCDKPVVVSREYVEEILTGVELGQGFFGVVWKGVDTVLNTTFAVKTIHQELVKKGHSADVQAARATFQRELDVSYRKPAAANQLEIV
jgi:hypothetical protein